MQNCKDPDIAMEAARRFTDVERKLLPRCYVPELLTGDTIWTLPLMHRFGWYCAQVFQRKDEGNLVGYAALLHKGFTTASEVKQMVEFLRDEPLGLV